MSFLDMVCLIVGLAAQQLIHDGNGEKKIWLKRGNQTEFG
jgi:hypothetical protein